MPNNKTAAGKDRLSKAKERKKKKILGWIYIVMILLVLCFCVWALFSVLGQIKTVTELTMDASTYIELDALPTQSEYDQLVKEEEHRIVEEAFAPKDSYPIDMIIQTPYCVLYDVQRKEVLYSKNAEEKAYPASTTKILTAAVMCENTPADTLFMAGDEQELVNPGSSLAMLNRGSILDRELMLDAIMLPSGNDAAYCAAAVTGRLIAGNEELSSKEAVNVFINAMNDKAREIGCKNSNFTCPDGFHDDNHYTTAMDLLRITLYSQSFPEVAVSGSKSYRDAEFISGETIFWNNSNRLIQVDDPNYYTYATGLKTGMTDMSGYCVVATAERFGHELILVCLGSETSAVRWNDTIALLDAGFAYIKKADSEPAPDEGSSDTSDDSDSGDDE